MPQAAEPAAWTNFMLDNERSPGHRALPEGNPTWLVVEGVAHFDSERQAWQIGYTMDDVHWESREA